MPNIINILKPNNIESLNEAFLTNINNCVKILLSFIFIVSLYTT